MLCFPKVFEILFLGVKCLVLDRSDHVIKSLGLEENAAVALAYLFTKAT